MKPGPISVVMLGASGAVGGCALQSLLTQKNIEKVSLLGRTPIPNLQSETISIEQHKIDIFDVNSYASFLPSHTYAICTLGVGQPSKISKEEFLKIDKTAVISFGKACKDAGIQHFELLSSVGISTTSSSFYLRTKAELVEELKALDFERLSIFQPSMILTPVNRYGIMQAISLKVWPWLDPILSGKARKYRGIPVDVLGKAMALNIFNTKPGFEILQWDDFMKITK